MLMQLVVPSAVAMADRMLSKIWTAQRIVSFFILADFFNHELNELEIYNLH